MLLTLLIIFLFGILVRRYPASILRFTNDAKRKAFMALAATKKNNLYDLYLGLGLWSAAIINS